MVPKELHCPARRDGEGVEDYDRDLQSSLQDLGA